MKNLLNKTSIAQYNNRIDIVNQIARIKNIKKLNFRNLRKIFNYLQFNLKLSEANLRLIKFSILRSIYECNLDRNKFDEIGKYREFFKTFKFKIRPAITDISQLPTLKDVAKLISYSSKKNSVLIETLYLTGLRNFEIRNLKHSNVSIDPKNKRVTISLIGKNKKKRLIKISKELFDRINFHWKGKNYLFENRNGEILTASTLRFILSESTKRIGCRVKITPKVLRISLINHIYQKFPKINSQYMSEKFGHTEATREKWYKLFLNKEDKLMLSFENQFSEVIKKTRRIA